MSRLAAVAIACAIAAPGVAHADAPLDEPTALDVDRDDAPPGRTELGFDGGAPVEGWGASIAGGWLEHPIELGLPDGTTVRPVRRRETVVVGGALALGDVAVIDARMAVAHQIGDRLRGTGDDAKLKRYVPGDLRIGGRLRVHARGPLGVFLRGDVALPTGDADNFAGDHGASLAWRLIGRLAFSNGIVAAATAGLRLRSTEVAIADRVLGNETLGAIGVSLPIPPIHPLWCVADQVRLTGEVDAVLGDDVGAAGRGPSPVVARLGLVTRPLPAWTIGVRVGTGLTDEIGSPRWHATIELAYRGDWQWMPRAAADQLDDQAAAGSE